MKSKVASAIWLGSFVALTAAVSPSASAQSQQQEFQREINVVHPIPTDPPAGLSQTDLAWYAWRLFAACNQGTAATLTAGSTRETPSSSFLSTGETPGPLPHPTIFEALYHRTEAYPYYTSTGAPPSPLKQVPVYRFSPIGTAPFTVTGGQYVNLDETNQIGQNFIYYRHSNDKQFPILFMAKVNSTAVAYAQGNAANNFQPSPASSWLFPPNGASKENTLEIKAAWRPVSDIAGDASGFHQATATWYEGLEGQVPTVKTGKFALIGLHIIQKSANYQSFMYSTFEHVDAVTRNGGVITDPAYALTYNMLSYDQATGPNPVANFRGAYNVNAPGQPPQNNQTTENFVLPPQGPAPNASHPPAPIEDGKYKVTYEPQTISREVNDVNNLVGQMLGNTVWRNYRLKGVQGTPTNDETTLDFYLANIVIETSEPGIQLFRGGVSGTGTSSFTNLRAQKNLSVGLVEKQPVPTPTYVMGGCMGCHGVAETELGTDFSFLPPSPLLSGGKAVDAVVPASVSAEVRAAAHKATAIRRGYLLQRRR